ncbi:transposase family protein [Streptomyces sp. NPDC005426]|uniref:transposase family protein n=1 Tax=Streptomyces sp. NPDC005426 TaxID=3155344 RepID=UPI0033A2A615
MTLRTGQSSGGESNWPSAGTARQRGTRGRTRGKDLGRCHHKAEDRACPIIIAHSRRFGPARHRPPCRAREHPQLLDRLATVPDPRRAKGRPHPLAFVLALAACAVLAGAKSLTAIAEWAADAPAAVLTALGGPSREPAGPTAPTEATVRRILQRVDGDALDAAIGAGLAARDPDRPPPDHDLGIRARRSLAVDGKTVCGARRVDGTQVHLLAAMTGTGLVAAQREVGAKTTRSPSCGRCSPTSTWPTPWSPSTPCTPRQPMPASWWRRRRPTTSP